MILWKNIVKRSRGSMAWALLILLAFLLGMWIRGGSGSSAPVHDHESVEASTAATVWTCSMHPQIRQPEPGACPICGMDLIPVASDQDGGSGSPRQLVLSEHARKLAGIETIPVRRRFVEAEIRMVGKIDYDETRVKRITAWVPGRLDRLFVDYTGTFVSEGDHLVHLYSPDLISAQEELLQALKTEIELTGASELTRSSALETSRAAREKLMLLGLTEDQIRRLEEGGETSDHVTIYSPIGGVVIHKNAVEGEYVNTGTPIYTIADLSRVWVKLDAYESDLPWVKYGQEVTFETEAHPGETFKGRITFIDPVVDERTRTVNVRVNLINEGGRLKPGMFVHATLRASLSEDGRAYDKGLAGKWISPMHPEIVKDGPGICDVCGMDLVPAESLGFLDLESPDAVAPLVIPASAPLITGKRAVVYVADPGEEGSFTGREVVLGPRAGDWYLLREGLEEGERVVVAGNFKIDSALQILARPSMMSPEGGGPALTGHAGHGGAAGSENAPLAPSGVESRVPAPMEVPGAFRGQLATVFDAYLEVQSGLSRDDLAKAKAGSVVLLDALKKVDMSLLDHEAHLAWMDELKKLRESAGAIAESDGIVGARARFEELSLAATRVAESFGTGMDGLLLVYHCPMAFGNRGADWLQATEGTENPYFGSAMFKCGSKLRSLPSEPVIMKGDAHE